MLIREGQTLPAIWRIAAKSALFQQDTSSNTRNGTSVRLNVFGRMKESAKQWLHAEHVEVVSAGLESHHRLCGSVDALRPTRAKR